MVTSLSGYQEEEEQVAQEHIAGGPDLEKVSQISYTFKFDEIMAHLLTWI